MSRFAAVSGKVRILGANSLGLAFFGLALLWLWMIAMIGGYSGHIGWAFHVLLLSAAAIGFLVFERKTGFVSTARRLFRKMFQSRLLVSLGRVTRWSFLNLLRVPVHVALSIAYLAGLFGTAIFLLLTMTN